MDCPRSSKINGDSSLSAGQKQTSDRSQPREDSKKKVEKIKTERTEKPLESHVFSCALKKCPASFKNFKGFEDHMKTHDRQLDFQCEICKKQFYSCHGAILHMQKRENKECCECGGKKKFPSFPALSRHFHLHLEKRENSEEMQENGGRQGEGTLDAVDPRIPVDVPEQESMDATETKENGISGEPSTVVLTAEPMETPAEATISLETTRKLRSRTRRPNSAEVEENGGRKGKARLDAVELPLPVDVPEQESMDSTDAVIDEENGISGETPSTAVQMTEPMGTLADTSISLETTRKLRSRTRRPNSADMEVNGGRKGTARLDAVHLRLPDDFPEQESMDSTETVENGISEETPSTAVQTAAPMETSAQISSETTRKLRSSARNSQMATEETAEDDGSERQDDGSEEPMEPLASNEDEIEEMSPEDGDEARGVEDGPEDGSNAVAPSDSEDDEENDTPASSSSETSARLLYSCPVRRCSFSARKFQELNNHMKSHTGRSLDFICEVCSKSFKTKKEAVRHIQKRQENNCCACSKRNLTNLLIHHRSHTGEKPYPCRHCTRRFARTEDRNKHQLTHSGEKPFGCKHCGQKFGQQGHLSRHIRYHTQEKPHTCEECGQKFSRRDNLNTHLKRRH